MADHASGAKKGYAGDRAPPAGDDTELRPLLLLLVLDGAVGLWSSLHATWLQRFFISQIPLFGLFGVVWGFLEDDVKKVVAARITTRLRRRRTYLTLVTLVGAFLVFTCLWSTVEVRALDPAGSEVLLRVNGAPLDVPRGAVPLDSAVCRAAGAVRDTASMRGPATPAADSSLLNRLTTPVDFGLWIWPTGRDVWFYTLTHVSARALRVWPWWRQSLQYPEDFDEVAVVNALPTFPLFKGLPAGCVIALIIREHDVHGNVLAADTLSGFSGLQLAYRDSIPLDSLARARWDDSLRLRARRAAALEAEGTGALPADSATLAQLDSMGASGRGTLTRRWALYRVIPTRRPLHVGEHIYWEVRGTRRALLASGEVQLRHATDILLGAP